MKEHVYSIDYARNFPGWMALFRDRDDLHLDSFGASSLLARGGSAGMINDVASMRWRVSRIHSAVERYKASYKATWQHGPLLWWDSEGVSLGRNGAISIIQLYIKLRMEAYLIDVHKLGFSTFNSRGLCGKTLKELLRSASSPITTEGSICAVKSMLLSTSLESRDRKSVV